MPKFRRATPSNSEVISANLLHFKPIFDPLLKNSCKGAPVAGGGYASKTWSFSSIIIIIIDNRGLNARWCLTPFLLSLPTAAYLGQRGLAPAGLSHTTAQCHLTMLGEAVLFCLNHLSFRTPGSLSFCRRSFCRYGRRGATFPVSLSAVGFLSIESFCTILH